jgi:replicative DNA helicase
LSEVTQTVPPNDPQAEESVIGSILIRNETLDLVLAEMAADDFYRESYRLIFAAMLKAADAHRPIDPVLLRGVVGDSEWKRIEGDRLCAEAIANTPAPSAAAYYAGEVHNRAMARAALAFGLQIIQKAASAPAPGTWSKDWTAEMVADLEHGVAEIVSKQISKPETPRAEAITEAIHRLEHGYGKGIGTGFRSVDTYFGGFDAGHLSILAARTSKGKTALAVNIAINAAKALIPTAFFTLEMTRQEMLVRCLGTLGQVDTFDARRHGLRMDRAERMKQAEAELLNLPLTILYRPSMNPRGFRLEAKKLMRETGLKFAIIDYFNLMRGNYRERERWREMQEVILALKEIACELDIPILLLSQLNREVSEDMPPSLSNLRDTGSAEEHSSNVLLLWQKPRSKDAPLTNYDDWEDIELILAKQRNGPTCRDIGLKFRKQWGVFVDG